MRRVPLCQPTKEEGSPLLQRASRLSAIPLTVRFLSPVSPQGSMSEPAPATAHRKQILTSLLLKAGMFANLSEGAALEDKKGTGHVWRKFGGRGSAGWPPSVPARLPFLDALVLRGICELARSWGGQARAAWGDVFCNGCKRARLLSPRIPGFACSAMLAGIGPSGWGRAVAAAAGRGE